MDCCLEVWAGTSAWGWALLDGDCYPEHHSDKEVAVHIGSEEVEVLADHPGNVAACDCYCPYSSCYLHARAVGPVVCHSH